MLGRCGLCERIPLRSTEDNGKDELKDNSKDQLKDHVKDQVQDNVGISLFRA